MTDPIIRFDGVDSGYGSRPILQDLSFSVQQGELLAIMGGSGSGKTTILRLIGALVRQQRGSIRVRSQALEGLDADGLRALRRHMGMLFQGGALFTDLTVFENVAFPLREHTRLPERMIRDLVL
ncbi:MAG: ATP-binding cassette domain-containing protein, partial [Betaproteobacteria bacterium]|nr:ATP-binding cassette domain-containing protein [Betaproteobacteria bacterium]